MQWPAGLFFEDWSSLDVATKLDAIAQKLGTHSLFCCSSHCSSSGPDPLVEILVCSPDSLVCARLDLVAAERERQIVCKPGQSDAGGLTWQCECCRKLERNCAELVRAKRVVASVTIALAYFIVLEGREDSIGWRFGFAHSGKLGSSASATAFRRLAERVWKEPVERLSQDLLAAIVRKAVESGLSFGQGDADSRPERLPRLLRQDPSAHHAGGAGHSCGQG